METMNTSQEALLTEICQDVTAQTFSRIASVFAEEIFIINSDMYSLHLAWSTKKDEDYFFPFDNSEKKSVKLIILSTITLDAFFLGDLERKVKQYIWWDGSINRPSFQEQQRTTIRYINKFRYAVLYVIVPSAEFEWWKRFQIRYPEINIVPLITLNCR
jgi:hypothetical protein